MKTCWLNEQWNYWHTVADGEPPLVGHILRCLGLRRHHQDQGGGCSYGFIYAVSPVVTGGYAVGVRPGFHTGCPQAVLQILCEFVVVMTVGDEEVRHLSYLSDGLGQQTRDNPT